MQNSCRLKIGVLALQGAFIEHELLIKNLGYAVCEIRTPEELNDPELVGLIIPGGESTAMLLLAERWHMVCRIGYI